VSSKATIDAMPALDRGAIENFLFREARIADEHRYLDWESLWTDDAIYWVPTDGANTDPEKHVSYIYDNRRRLHTRLSMLATGDRLAQVPPSGICRILSNIEIGDRDDQGDVPVWANFMLLESRRDHNVWGGRVTYKLRPDGDSFKLVEKKVVLTNSAEAIHKIAFIL
jgi:benzoate/toluate 1,2-dioxygenase beta subunit